MGRPIHTDLEQKIIHYLNVDIKQPLLGQGPQYVKQVSHIQLEGNIDDCGPMLVYCITCINHNISIRSAHSKEESNSIGSFLRESFDGRKDFNEIYYRLIEEKNFETKNSLKNSIVQGEEQKDIEISLPYVDISQLNKENIAFRNTFELAESVMSAFSIIFNPMADNVRNPEHVFQLLINDSSLMSQASQLARMRSSVGDSPSFKKSEMDTLYELMIRTAMNERPHYFNTGAPISEESPNEIAFKLFQEFARDNGTLDHLYDVIKEKIKKDESLNNNAAVLEFVDLCYKFLKDMGSGKSPIQDFWNKYVDQKDIEEIQSLHEWLSNNQQDANYDINQRRFAELDAIIQQNRDKAMEEGSLYMQDLMRRLSNSDDKTTDLQHQLKVKYENSKNEELKTYVLKFIQPGIFEKNILRHFWENVARQQLGPAIYDISTLR